MSTLAQIYRHLWLFLLATCFTLPSLADEPKRIGPPLKSQQSVALKSTEAEVLHHIEHVELLDNDHWRRTSYVSIRVNSIESARDYGRISIPFNHYYSEMHLDFANTLSPNGNIKRVLADAIQERVTGGGQDFYSDRSELVFSLPDINPGSILEFQFSGKSKVRPIPSLFSDTVSPYWFQSTVAKDGWRADYLHHHKYTLSYPASTHISLKTYAGYAPKKARAHASERIIDTWETHAIPAVTSEQWLPIWHSLIPQMRLSTLDDWQAINNWTWNLVKEKLSPTPTITQIAQQIGRDLPESKAEKVKAVYAYVQKNIRYVFAHLGRGGYEPHFPAETHDAKYGDCKDQTILTIALLNALGVEAYPALIQTPKSGRDDQAIVELFFDHMITYIPEQAGLPATWLDTTGDRSLYPGISNYLAEQNALIVKPKRGILTRLSADTLNANRANLDLNLRRNEQGQTVADLRIFLSGTYEQNMRSWWAYNSNRENELEQFVSGFYNTQLGYELTTQLHNQDEVFDPVYITATYTFKKDEDGEPISFSASVSQLLSMYADISSLPNPASRTHRFYAPYPIELEMHVSFMGEKGTIPALVQSSDGLKNQFFTLQQRGSSKGNEYRYAINFERQPLDLSTEEYTHFHEQINQALQLKPWVVTLIKDNSAAPAAVTAHSTVETRIKHTEQLLQQGKFKEALIAAEEAVSIHTDNGKAWYLLGTAQGLNALFDESDESFKQAHALGFLP